VVTHSLSSSPFLFLGGLAGGWLRFNLANGGALLELTFMSFVRGELGFFSLWFAFVLFHSYMGCMVVETFEPCFLSLEF